MTARKPPFPPFPQFPHDVDAVRRWAALAPGRKALIDDATGARWSYGALDAEAWGWTCVLAERGVGAGDRVGLLAGTRAECVALFHACLRLGAVLVPLNWRLSPAELSRVFADAAPTLCVVESRFAPLLARALAREEAPAGVPVVSLEGVEPARAPAHAASLDAGNAASADAATMLLYTSGSTGRPKGVVLPRRQLLYNAVSTLTGWRLGPDEVVPVSTPLFHTGGWHVLLTPVLHAGGTVVLIDGFEPTRFLGALAEHGCTLAFAVPTQFTMLAGDARWGGPLPALRRFVSGGAPCPPALRTAIREAGYGFHEGYGLTECGPNCFATSDAAATAHPGTVGWPAPFVETRLVDEGGRDVRAGEPGELLLRAPQMFAGYFRAPERTAEVMTADGWLRTGDLATRDASGLFRVCGRRKEMYISGGENVFPGEVEAVLADCPGVAEVAVLGVPDARWGEVGCAFVVSQDGVDAAAILAHARGALAGYKVPKRVVLLDALPRLGSGKVDRQALAMTTTAAQSAAEATA